MKSNLLWDLSVCVCNVGVCFLGYWCVYVCGCLFQCLSAQVCASVLCSQFIVVILSWLINSQFLCVLFHLYARIGMSFSMFVSCACLYACTCVCEVVVLWRCIEYIYVFVCTFKGTKKQLDLCKTLLQNWISVEFSRVDRLPLCVCFLSLFCFLFCLFVYVKKLVWAKHSFRHWNFTQESMPPHAPDSTVINNVSVSAPLICQKRPIYNNKKACQITSA